MAAGVACGIKASGDPDLSLVATDDGRPVVAAAVFTTNKATAGPVQRQPGPPGRHRRTGRGRGPQQRLRQRRHRRHRRRRRRADVRAGGGRASAASPTEVLVCSTGLIGYYLPMAAVEAGIPPLVAARREDGGPAAAQAIMTTDTVPKEVVGRRSTATPSAGWPRGRPCSPPTWPPCWPCSPPTRWPIPTTLLRPAAGGGGRTRSTPSSVDGCTSTNDTVIVLANGRSGRPLEHRPS